MPIPSTSNRGLSKTSTAIGVNIEASPAAIFQIPYTKDANLAGKSS